MDEVIERELQTLRSPAESRHGLGDAIRAMQAPPVVKVWKGVRWRIGVGSAVVAACAGIIVVSLSTPKAYAGELRAIELAQGSQRAVHQKSILFDRSEEPVLIMEFWVDHERQAYRQFSADGKLQIVRVSDGKRTYHYTAGNPSSGSAPWGGVSDDEDPDFGIETLHTLMTSKLAREHKVEKKRGVRLNGRTCDFYSVANGYYRIWVDPATKLPVQREIYDRGVTLWKRDFYDYPATFAASTFKPFQQEGLTYVDRTAQQRALKGRPQESQKASAPQTSPISPSVP